MAPKHQSRADAIAVGLIVALSVGMSAPAWSNDVCPKRGGTLKTVDVVYSAMDPAVRAHPNYYIQLLFDPLIEATPDIEFRPGLAESMPEKLNDMSYRLTLRQGIRFHDGTMLDAGAVKFNIDRLRDGAVVSPYTGTWRRFLKEAVVEDARTIRLDFKEAWPGFLWDLSTTLFIASPAAIERLGDRFGIDEAPGTGPFKFVSIDPKKKLVLERNPDYYREGEPCLDGFNATHIDSASIRLLSLEKGDLHLIGTFPESQLQVVEDIANVTVQEGEASTFTLLPVNTRVEALRDRRVRQAIQYAIDGQELVDKVYRGRGVMIESIYPPWHPGFLPAEDLSPIRPDLDKARALLAQAGYGPDNPLTVELQTGAGGAHVERGVLLQAQLKRVGVTVELRTIGAGQLLSNLSSGNYQLALWQMQGGPTLKDYSWDLYSGDSTTNITGYNKEGGYRNEEATRLSQRIAAASDAARVRAEIARLQEIVFEDLPYIYVNFRNHRNAFRDEVRNFHTADLKGREDIRQVWLDN